MQDLTPTVLDPDGPDPDGACATVRDPDGADGSIRRECQCPNGQGAGQGLSMAHGAGCEQAGTATARAAFARRCSGASPSPALCRRCGWVSVHASRRSSLKPRLR